MNGVNVSKKEETSHIWKYVRAIMNGVYGKMGESEAIDQYRKMVSNRRDRRIVEIDRDFLERVWRIVPIEQFIYDFLTGSRYMGIGISFSCKRLNECEAIYRFHFCGSNEEKTDLIVDDCTIKHHGVGLLSGDDLVMIHRKIFDLFAHLVDQDLLKEKIKLMKRHLSEDRRLPFNSESQSDIG